MSGHPPPENRWVTTSVPVVSLPAPGPTFIITLPGPDYPLLVTINGKVAFSVDKLGRVKFDWEVIREASKRPIADWSSYDDEVFLLSRVLVAAHDGKGD